MKPTVVTYGTTMQALAASGRHIEAFDLLASMKRVRGAGRGDGLVLSEGSFVVAHRICPSSTVYTGGRAAERRGAGVGGGGLPCGRAPGQDRAAQVGAVSKRRGQSALLVFALSGLTRSYTCWHAQADQGIGTAAQGRRIPRGGGRVCLGVGRDAQESRGVCVVVS